MFSKNSLDVFRKSLNGLYMNDNLIVDQYPTDSGIGNSVVNNISESDNKNESENLQKEKKNSKGNNGFFRVIRRGFYNKENIPYSILHSVLNC